VGAVFGMLVGEVEEPGRERGGVAGVDGGGEAHGGGFGGGDGGGGDMRCLASTYLILQ